jgi:Tfp pilus assembly protein PilN
MMPSINIDFGGRRARLPLAGVVLLIAASLLLMMSGELLWRAYQDEARAQENFERTAQRDIVKKRPQTVAPTPADTLARKQGQAVMRELTAPWQNLLSIVEDYPAHDVALIGIDQNPAQSQIRITAEAKDFDAMIAYLKYLQSSALLREAVLNGHLIETNEPGTPVRFEITAVWRRS